MQSVKVGDWRGTKGGTFDPAAISDLRRKLESTAADRLLARSEFLPPADRALLRSIYADGKPATEVAALIGRSARHVRVRVRALAKRVMSPVFAFVVAHGATWPESRRRVGISCFVNGQSQRDAAASLGTSLHAVRRHCQAIQDLSNAMPARAGEVAA